MEFIRQALQYIENLPQILEQLFQQNSLIAYAILWLDLFLETGVPIFSFLPGNSVVLASAAFAAGSKQIHILPLSLVVLSATLLADHANFFLGRYFGRKYRDQNKLRFIDPNHVKKAHRFFDSHGRKAFLVSRFIPIFRAAMPFAAGFSQTSYRRISPFLSGGVTAWCTVYLSAGYFFGHLPIVKENFSLLMAIILTVTMIPTLLVVFYNYRKLKSGGFDDEAQGE